MNNMENTATHTAQSLLQIFRGCYPPIGCESHASPHDIVVLGGNVTHTGAIYRIAITALRAGAYGARAYCPPETAAPLAALAPDIACTASLRVDDLTTAAALVIGPGLGRSIVGAKCVAFGLRTALSRFLPVIIDASSLFALAHHPEVRRALMDAPDNAPAPMVVGDLTDMATLRSAPALLGHLACIQWSESALVGVGKVRCMVTNRQSDKPLVAMQHVLAGVVATFTSWAHARGLGGRADERAAAAATAALMVTRRASELAFDRYGRSVMVTDVIEEIAQAVQELENRSSHRVVKSLKPKKSSPKESMELPSFPITADLPADRMNSFQVPKSPNLSPPPPPQNPPLFQPSRSEADTRDSFDPMKHVHVHLHPGGGRQ